MTIELQHGRELPSCESPTGGQATYRTVINRAAELAAAIAVACIVSLVVQWAAARLSLPEPSSAKLEVVVTVVTVLLAVLALLVMRAGSVWRWWQTAAVWSVLAALSSSILAIPLHGTRWYLGGVDGDNRFRIPYFTHMTASPNLSDMTYQHLPSFYSAGWFWVGGRFAAAAGLQGWAAYKIFAIMTMAMVPALAFSLWSFIVSSRVAVILSIATALTGTMVSPSMPAWEPYAWLMYGLTPPVAVALGRVLRNRESGRPDSRRWALVAVGVFIGIAGDTYTIVAAMLALMALGYFITAAASRRGKIKLSEPVAPLTTLALRIVGIGAVALAVMLPVWAGYLAKAISAGMPPNPAQDYLYDGAATYTLPMLDPSPQGVFFLLGVAWMVWAVRSSEIASSLLALIGVAYAWQVLSTLALFKNTTLLAGNTAIVLFPTLYCAGALAVVDIAKWAWRRHPDAVKRCPPAVLAGFGVLAAVSVIQRGELDMSGQVDAAYKQSYPTGTIPASGISALTGLAVPFALPQTPSTRDIDNAIRDLTGKSPQEVEILNPSDALVSEYPYWSFQADVPQYSNPLAKYDMRNAEIQRWATAKTPQELLNMLDSSPFDTPSVFMFSPQADGWHAHIEIDTHVLNPEHIGHDVVFDPSAFDSGAFVKRTVGSTVIVVRR